MNVKQASTERIISLIFNINPGLSIITQKTTTRTLSHITQRDLTREICAYVTYYLVFYNIHMYIVLYFISCFPVEGCSLAAESSI